MYNHQEIEQKWQKYWSENKTFRTPNTFEKPGYYVLDMFPYPSGAGLHVGHPEGYTANDIVARYKHAKGYNVLHPMGWDAFGLPAENYAIKTGIHPKITTAENIATFKRQIQSLGFSYDWEREIDTTDPKYFQWTQWIFLKLFEAGLAYEQDLPINYCPSCKTGLANEEVLSDFSCERCGTQVEKKKIRQWVLAITKYAERLLSDVDNLDWPEGIKDMQRNWIGKSEGCEFEMKKAGDESKTIRVYTTRVDTVFGMTYAVIAPDHADVEQFITEKNRTACEGYIKKAGQQSDQDRIADDKEKTGVFTGSYVVNPYNNEEVPLWIADYVLGNYGTGAVMAVPAHDERDFEFAKKYNLEIRQVVARKIVGEGDIKPREGLEYLERVYVNAIIEYEGKFLMLKEKVGSKFVGGGMEDGETPLQAIKREILEETGYTDFGSISQIQNSAFYGYAYRNTKGVNQKGFDEPYFYIKLASLSKEEISDEEAAIATPIWVEKIEVEKLLISNGHLHAWDFFIKPRATKEYNFLMASEKYNKMSCQEAKELFTQIAEEKGFGHKKTNYKLRDWLFSRQRYWGEPIPLIHITNEDYDALPRISDMSEKMEENTAYIYDKKGTDKRCKNCTCGDVGCTKLIINGKSFSRVYDGIYGKIVCDYRLPLELPQVDAYEPAGDGQSPLVKVPEFVYVELAKNLKGKRETNTMPQWGGSCWYYLRFMDVHNSEKLVDSEIEKYWGSVDSYVGGAEHAVLHLLYARFWHKFLYDIGVVSTQEPFHRLRNQGMILGMSYKNAAGKLIASDMVEEKEGKFIDTETGDILEKIPAKMSKSLKNVVNPDEIVQEYGADTLRLYEMYMGDFADTKPWDTQSIVGLRRFLDRVYNLFIEGTGKVAEDDNEALRNIHKTIKKVGSDIENYKFNTAIAQMMICLNYGAPKDEAKQFFWKESFVKLLHPFAPHMAEEIWGCMTPKQEKILKIHLATGNKQKLERIQKVFSRIDENMHFEIYPELVEVEESGDTPMECALQKLEPYRETEIQYPIIAIDTAVYFDGQETHPTHVKRSALAAIGKTESECTQEQIASAMVEYYKNIAHKAGGKKEFNYIDALAVLYPDGVIETAQWKREYILLDTEHSPTQLYFPMRSLFISKITGRGDHNASEDDFFMEMQGQSDALKELFGYGKESIFFSDWPEYDEEMTVDNEVTIGVQVLGKLRGEIKIAVDEDKESVLSKARTQEGILKWLAGKEIVKEIYVPGKIVNIVVK